jgi:hypothetical protein
MRDGSLFYHRNNKKGDNHMEKFLYYVTPFVIFFFYRIIMCFIELKRNERERVRKNVFHSVKHLYAEIGLFSGAAVGGLLVLLMPRLWYVFLVITVALSAIGYKLGRQRGIAFDDMLRELALEYKRLHAESLETEEHPALAENAGADAGAAADEAAAGEAAAGEAGADENAAGDAAAEGGDAPAEGAAAAEVHPVTEEKADTAAGSDEPAGDEDKGEMA